MLTKIEKSKQNGERKETMRIPIIAVKRVAQAHNLSHCVVFGWDGKQQQIATWGRTIEACSQAADFGNMMKETLSWPKSLCDAQPSRVRKLQARIKELEEALHNEQTG